MILIAINITAFICLFVTTELTYLLITSFASFTSLIVSNVFLVNKPVGNQITVFTIRMREQCLAASRHVQSLCLEKITTAVNS